MNKLKINFELKPDINSWEYPLTGEIYSYTTVNFPIQGYENPPYYIGLVKLEEKNIIYLKFR